MDVPTFSVQMVELVKNEDEKYSFGRANGSILQRLQNAVVSYMTAVEEPFQRRKKDSVRSQSPLTDTSNGKMTSPTTYRIFTSQMS